ncbi:MAG: hypothetical protein MUP09_07025 [Thiovulaceae bacterium]|nr:hypothetical protein [Sulfurimonadaceae bacterium]
MGNNIGHLPFFSDLKTTAVDASLIKNGLFKEARKVLHRSISLLSAVGRGL